MLGRALAVLDRAAFRPDTLPAWTITAIALVPCVIAGTIIFGVTALLDVAIALAIGLAAHAAGLRLRLGISDSPVISSLFATALLGAASSPALVAAVALVAALLSLVRDRLAPRLRVQPGLLGFAAAYAVSAGGTSAYLNPSTHTALAEPIRLWQQTGSLLFDPTRLYVGNVPGPLFATSLLAVVIAAAWFWYARRLSLVVVVTCIAGALAPVLLMRWNAGYQLDSGPTFFVVALALADRRLLPTSNAVRPLLGLLAGAVGVGLRSGGAGVEAMALTVAGLQLLVGVFEGAEWLAANRAVVADRLRTLRRDTLRFARRRAA